MSATVYRQDEAPGAPTQFALVPPDRVVDLIAHYEAMKVDAEYLPPRPESPPLAYIEARLSELRRELVARKFGTVTA